MYLSFSLLFRMLLAILFFLVLSIQVVAQAPSFAWAMSDGGTGQNHGYGIAVDDSGNSYVTGWFSYDVAFGSTTLSSSGSADIFLAKYDASGNVLWVQQAGGTNYDTGHDIAIDDSGNSYVTGLFNGTATFDTITLISSGLSDVFITKYDPSGNVLWAKKAGGTDFDGSFGIAVDGSGNSYLVGDFEDTVTFGGTTLSSSGEYDIFITKYDTFGNVLWAQKAGGTVDDYGRDIALDSSGNSYVTGAFQGTATFGSTTLNSSGSNDIFIAKYDTAGTLLWVSKAGGNNSNDGGNGIAVDGSGNSYVTGFFDGTVTFDSTTFSTYGSYDVFIAKYDITGTLLWAKQAGGTGYDCSIDISVDNIGNSYLTGVFDRTATFGSTTLNSNGDIDIYIANYDTNGNGLWAQKAGGDSYDAGWGIAVDSSGNCYATGSIIGPANFGSIPLISNGGSDMFICKLSSTILGLPSEINAALPTYPNPFTTSFQISLPSSGPATVVLTDVLGREVHRQAVAPPAAKSTVIITPAAHLPSGVYGLQIRQSDSVRQGKVLKQ